MDRNSVSTWVVRAAFLLAVVATLLLGAGSSLAQVDTGSIQGTVTDASGASISGAKVVLLNQGTAASLATTTSPDGGFKFSPVRIGTYTVTVTFEGFQTSTQKDIPVNVGSDVVANFTLQPGKVSEIIEVTGAAPVLQSQDASVGQVMDTQAVNNLPLNGRNFTFLAQLGAGVNTPQADTRGNAATGAFSANGLRPAQNNYLLDGIDNNSDTVDFLNGTNFVVLPPVDAIQEFKVETSGFSAQYGRSGAAVLNATIKSGTNQLHGAAWEFFRNDVLDAADYFENAGGVPKGALRQNQFGVAIGGPVVIPHVINGRNKLFFFADYEGLRRVQGTILTGSVPTVAERDSFDTNTLNFTDLISAQSGTHTDALGRILPKGTILDPSTTRATTAGAVDPNTGLVATSSGFVRNPFTNGSCANNTTNFTGAAVSACGLNQIPVLNGLGQPQVDANAIALLQLYPLPSNGNVFSNFANSPKLYEHRNSFDTRMDANFSEHDQLFFRFSYVDDPQFIPGIFGGIADGGGFQQGNQTANATQTVLGWTHTFNPTAINVAHVGFNYLHTTRVSPSANDLSNIPLTYGIQDIPQDSENGGLPAFGINGLQTLGSNAFLPSDEVSSTFQATDDFTKIYGKHTFKAGFEYQHVKFSTLQPPWSRGEFDYNGDYTDVVNSNNGNTGRAAFLLIPQRATVPGGVDYLGGSTNVFVSNISLTDNGKNYYGGYVNDDWKLTNKLTINLGVRWDYFGLVLEHHANQANFVPGGPPTGGAMYIIPSGPNAGNLSGNFLAQLAADNITPVATNVYGKGLGNSQANNFAPRVGFAYQISPKLVARGGFGIFYNGFENRGFSPNLGENYPFQFNFNYSEPNNHTSVTFPGCDTAGPGNTATFETGFSCTPLDPLLVSARGLGLRGIQFDYQTPYSMGGNLTLQYQLTPTMSLQGAYVTSLARHLEVFPNSNNVTQLFPASTALDGKVDPITNLTVGSLRPFPGFSGGNSFAATEGTSAYHGLQTRLEKQFGGGLSFLATYTWSKTLTDALDLLNNPGSAGNYRAPDIPGFGIKQDRGLASFDIRNVFHFSGSYDLPFGQGKKFGSNASGFSNQVIGGWSVNTIITIQGGQPITFTCPTTTAAGTNCYDLRVSGENPKLGIYTDTNGRPNWIGNPGAFAQPCTLGPGGAPLTTPTGCVPLAGLAALGGYHTSIPGPGFQRWDFSLFKNFTFKERYTLQFRTEIFNVINHPNFNAPNFGGNGVVAIGGSGDLTSSNFGEIGSTRDAPYDARQIQFALKFLF